MFDELSELKSVSNLRNAVRYSVNFFPNERRREQQKQFPWRACTAYKMNILLTFYKSSWKSSRRDESREGKFT